MNFSVINFFAKNKTIQLFFFALVITWAGCLLFAPQNAQAATYYVSTTGTDDDSHGTGTGADAWATLDYALRGSRVAKGDTINVEAGTYDAFNGADNRIEPTIDTSTGSGPVIIQAYPSDASVIFDMPAATSPSYAYLYLNATRWGEFTFKNIDFTNSGNVTATYFWIYGHNLTFEDCTITLGTNNLAGINIATDTDSTNLTITRTSFANSGSNKKTIRNISQVGANITIDSSLFYDQVFYIFDFSVATNATITNSTFVTSYAKFYLPDNAAGSVFTVKNNIFYTDTSTDYRPFVMVDAVATDLIDNPSHWDVTNNVWFRSSDYQYFIGGMNHLVPVDGTNHFIDPSFTDKAGDDYSIQAGSDICGLGSNSDLPGGGDFSAAAWTGNDIGAYKCPSATTSVTLLDKVAFVGDSIMLAGDAVEYFSGETGEAYVDPADAAISGAQLQKIFDSIDTVMLNSSPSTVFLSAGINNLSLEQPSSATNQEYANYILEMMAKIEGWGATPIWLGIGTLNNYGGLSDTNIPLINALVETGCSSHSWKCDNYYNQMLFNSSWQSASPDGYYDTDGNVHPNTDGQIIIGKLAEYLYYDNHTLGTDEIDIGGGARVYSNGKFRDHGTTSGTTADLSATPVNGDYYSSDYSYWLDLTVDTWQTTDVQNKQWTASSTVATTTVFTVGDLAADRYYQFKLDGVASSTAITSSACTDGICLADGSGNLTFTYTGNFSDHIFALEQDTNAPTNVGISSVTADSDTQLTVVGTATDADPGLHASPYWFDETSGESGATDSTDWQASESYVDSGLTANTQYTYRVKARDGNTNESSYSTTVSKYTLAPTPSNFAGSSTFTSISLSVDSFNNDTTDSSGYYFSRSGSNSGWIQTNSWQESGLTCGTSYTYSVKYRNAEGTETSASNLTVSTATCIGGGGLIYMPSVGTGKTSLNFFIGQTQTISDLNTKGVNILTYVNSPLIFSLADSKTQYTFVVSSLDTTTGLIIINLPIGSFKLSPGDVQEYDLNKDGNKDFKISYNQLFINQIDLTLSQVEQSTASAGDIADGSLVKLPDDPAVYLIENGVKRHITDEATFLARGFSWNDVVEVDNLNDFVSGGTISLYDSGQGDISPPGNYSFSRDLELGDYNDEVLALQQFLNNQGFILADSGPGSPGNETKYFGQLTKQAVINFQNKYQKQILAPLGLSGGTGYFGPATREFVNSL